MNTKMYVGIITIYTLLWASTSSASSIIKIYTPDDKGGSYPIEFTTVCGDSFVTYVGAKGLCTGLGAEWSLGMTPTENISREVHTHLINETTWVDGEKHYSNGKRFWRWDKTVRRDKVIRFAKNEAWECNDDSYCNMSFPLTDKEVCFGYYDDFLVILASGRWQQRNQNAVSEGADCFPAKCALCHRFPCDIATDCNENNTDNVTGSAPNCVCHCKESFSGDRCQYASVDYGTYKASYSAACADSSLSYSSAVSKCKALGDGWNLAALPTNASAAVRSQLLPSGAAWMAAKRDGDTWKWAAGRSEGKPMNANSSAYAPWKAGSPSDATQTACASNGRVAFSNAEAEWVDCATVQATEYPRCYICERSACTVTADCEPSGTESVSTNYYGSCVCNCKEQWGGKRCELFTTIDTDTFSTEYTVTCRSDPISFSYADMLCTRLGTGWSLASPATEPAARLLAELVRVKDEQAWLSGKKSNGQWKWTAGRFKDQVFASGDGECGDSFYCNWADGAPITGSCRRWSGYDPTYVVINKEGNWSNTEAQFNSWSSNSNKCPPTKCSACERSACNISADCYAGGTLTVTGSYYPNCECTCKPGYSGSRCETLTFSAVNGPAEEAAKQYTSDYRLSCATTPQTYTDAEAACRQVGSTWVLGTLPSAAATEAMRAANSTSVSIWLAAGFVTGSGWQWLGGRLKGKPLSSYTNWGDGAPHNDTTSTCDSTTRTAVTVDADGNWTDIYNDTACNTLPSCYLCERPGCVLEEDCETNHTESVSGYYGQCVCVCKEGWAGPRCEKDSKLVREKYVMEYYIGCDETKSNIRFDEANSHCKARGNGWTIAASPDETTNDKLAYLIEENAWIAGERKQISWSYKWGWWAGHYNGRYKDTVFGTGYNCIGWCQFSSGAPTFSSACGYYNDNLILNSDGTWLQQNKYQTSGWSCHFARCYLCERSRCNITADCFTGGTESVTGWYPSCHCVCKPGFKGDKCNLFFFVSAAAPLSFEYLGICDVNNDPVAWSAAKCSTLGSSYTIASFATANATTDYTSFLNQSGIVAWIGAKRVDGNFQWTKGRFSGQAVDANMTNYHSGRPSSETCSSVYTQYLSITDEGVVYDNYDDSQCDKSLGNPAVSCYVCERSPCVLEVDCNATNTLRVSGYYGDCRCYCNSEYGGPRCDDYNVVNSTTYVTQYTVGCKETYISLSKAEGACTELGDGWMIAAVPSAESNSNIQKFIPDGERAWLGGYISSSTNKWTWGGTGTDYYNNPEGASSYTGRSKGVNFADTTSCDSDVWCNFTAGSPSSPGWIECSGWKRKRFVGMNSDGTWQQTADTTSSWNNCLPSRCYACERSPCSVAKDCFAKGTVNVTGYYPNCKCHCKGNFTGEKCDTAIHYGEAYVSEYKLTCSTQAIPYTSDTLSARNFCQDIGDAWDVATVLTAAAAETVLSLLDESQTAWLAGTDQIIEGEWRWKAGRQKGILFYKDAPVNGYYSAWGTGWPRNESCGGRSSDYLVTLGNGTWVHTYYDAFDNCPLTQPLPFCTVCERQPCNIALDCDVNNSVSVEGSYPQCRCVCKEGWGGARCNVSSIVYNNVVGGGYFSEYNVKCEDNFIPFDDTEEKCKALGEGWVLASVPSEEANNLIASMANERIWLGAKEIGRTYSWFTKTRAKEHSLTQYHSGYRYTCRQDTYCNIDGSINTYEQVACGTYRSRLAMDTDKFWRGYSSTREINDCVKLARCYACERSPCNATLDCKGENTERATGYYPSCECHCKFGYYGSKCENDGLVPDSNESDPNTYATMYRFECSSARISYEEALDKCREYGDSWQLATVGSLAALNKISSSVSSSTYWLAGFDTKEGWKWQTGRLNGKLFYKDGSCQQQACGFGDGQPVESEAFSEQCYRKLATQGTKWSALLPETSCSFSTTLPRCYVCERSQCKHITDCNVTHSDNVTGFYPNCQCGCHAGWGGSRCSERVCHVDTDCAGLAANVTGEYPHCQCIGCPKGHRARDCATLTSSATLSSTPTVELKTGTLSATHLNNARRTVSRTFTVMNATTTETSETNNTTTGNDTTNMTEITDETTVTTSELTEAKNETTNETIETIETTTISDTTETTTEPTTETTTTTETTNETTRDEASNETVPTTTDDNTTTTVAPDTSATTTSALCQFKFNISCDRSIYYEPTPSINLPLEISALVSAPSVSLLLPISLIPNSNVPLTAHIGWSPDNRSEQLKATGAVVKQDGLVLTIVPLVNPTQLTDSDFFVFVNGCCHNLEPEDTIRLAGVKLVAAPKAKNETIGVVDEDLQQDFANAAESSKSHLRDERSWLLGAPEDTQVLRAFSPVALIVGGSDGYISLLLSNLIVIVVVTVIHFIAVMVYRVRTQLPFAEVCAIMSFPSLSLYVIYALLPGIALAAGGLTRVGSAVGVVALLFVLVVVVNSGLYPYLYLTRGLYSVPLLPGKPQTKQSIIFPTTILAPSEVASAYAALVKNYRYPLALWTTLPTWSSLVILIASLFPTTFAICIVVGVVHCIAILIVIIMSPHSCLALDVMYCLGILPVAALAIVRGIQVNDGQGSLESVSDALLIILTIVTALRLGAALCSPFKILTLASYDNITHEAPLWVFHSKCGPEFQSLNDLEVAMFSFKEASDVAGEGVLFPDNGSSVSAASGQPGRVMPKGMDSSSSVGSAMPVAVPNAETHSVRSSANEDGMESSRDNVKDTQSGVIGDNQSSISGASPVNPPPQDDDPFE